MKKCIRLQMKHDALIKKSINFVGLDDEGNSVLCIWVLMFPS